MDSIADCWFRRFSINAAARSSQPVVGLSFKLRFKLAAVVVCRRCRIGGIEALGEKSMERLIGNGLSIMFGGVVGSSLLDSVSGEEFDCLSVLRTSCSSSDREVSVFAIN